MGSAKFTRKNGESLNAALGVVASQLAAGEIKEVANNIAASWTKNPATREVLANILINMASGATGGLVGGETGSASASTMDGYAKQWPKVKRARDDATKVERKKWKAEKQRRAEER